MFSLIFKVIGWSIIVWSISVQLVFCQATFYVSYDSNGNRLFKKQQGSSQSLTISAAPSSVSLNQASTLTASGCPGTIKWSTGQLGASISVTPVVTTQYTASCITADCPTSGIGQVTVEVYQCQPDAIGITSTLYSARYGQAVTLTTYGCPGAVQWSNGQTGFTITPQVYGSTSTFTATCSKRNCPNSGSGSISITAVSGCNSGDVLVTIQSGDWDAATTWACGRIPTITDEVYLMHTITVNRNNNYAKTITLGGGYIINSSSGSVTLQPN